MNPHCWHPFDGDERSERGEDVICCNCGLTSVRWRSYPEATLEGHGKWARGADYVYDRFTTERCHPPREP